jgi:hypothetical protein
MTAVRKKLSRVWQRLRDCDLVAKVPKLGRRLLALFLESHFRASQHNDLSLMHYVVRQDDPFFNRVSSFNFDI